MPIQPKWLIYTRGTIHLHRFAGVLRAIADGLDKNIYTSPVKNLLFMITGDKLWFAWKQQELAAYGRKIVEIVKQPSRFRRQAKKIEGYAKLLNNISEGVRKTHLK